MGRKKVEISENQFKVQFYAKLAKELNVTNGVPFQKSHEKEAQKAWNLKKKSK